MNNLHYLSEEEDFIEFVEHFLHPRLPRVFRERPNHFIIWRDTEFLQRFRLSKVVVRNIIEEISPQIRANSRRNNALTPADKVFLTLRYLATGSILQVVGDFSGINKATASRTIHQVTRVLAGINRIYIRMPQGEEIMSVRQEFYNISKFPRCIGALDCTHVKIQSPGGPEPENYRNRKGFFSFNVQVVCDATLKIRNIVCRWPGASHDANIFRNSTLRVQFENGEFGYNLLVGDSGYGVKSYLMTPLGNPQTPAENLYNESQIRTRNPIERCFGVWKRRFPILALGIKLKTEKVEAIVMASAVLHNIACEQRDLLPQVNPEMEAAVELGNIAPINLNQNRVNYVRNALVYDYFQSLLNIY